MIGADDPKEYSELVALWPNMPKQVEPFELDDEHVPPEIRVLIPYARLWGNPDDEYRSDALRQTPESLRRHLKSVVIAKEAELEAWLAKPESRSSTRTSTFDAFVALLMATDSI